MNLCRTTIATMLFTFLAAAAWGQGAVADKSASATPQPQPKHLQILFTDHLLGYYRIPDAQAEDFQALCPEAAPGTPAKELLGDLGDIQKGNNTILVGMGNNFAVELGSRTYQDTSGVHAKLRDPGAKFSPGKIGDNVSCFLSRAGYDALVPGKEDFYFGAARLRLIAQQLASVPKSDGQDSVHMLAANLAVKADYWQKPKDIPDSEKSLKFETDLPDKIDSLDIADGDTVLPFLKRVRFKADSDFHPYLCTAGKTDPDNLNKCEKRANLKPVDPTGEESKGGILAYEVFEDLQAGDNYGLCAEPAKKKKVEADRFGNTKQEPHCLRFFVTQPYFLAPSGKEGSYDLPYVYLENKKVVIFGVVDPDLRSYVGRDNMSWINEKDPKKYKTEVTVLDPARSLQQAVQLFEEQHPVVAGDVSRVLLAEMSRDQAEELATHTGFDVVIAGGADYAHATSNRCIELDRDPEVLASDGKSPFRAVVVVPWSGYEYSKPHLVKPLRQLDLNDEATGETGRAAQWQTRTYGLPRAL
jgi:hypothetical protein